MLKIENAIRVDTVDYRPTGGDLIKVYVFNCLDCEKEIRVQKSALKKRTGKCVRCVKRNYPPFFSLFNQFKFHAKRAGHDVLISFEDFLEFTKVETCRYCGKEIQWQSYGPGPYNLDRKDSCRGYEKENISICCFKCNNLKSNFFTDDEFVAVMATVKIMRQSKNDSQELLYTLISWNDKNGWKAP